MANEDATRPVDRETLYNEVWAEPVSIVAPRYGLSDVGLAKICRKLAIPLPSRGYWAKVQAGRSMGRVALPELKQPTQRNTSLVKLPSLEAAARQAAKQEAARVRKEVQSELTTTYPKPTAIPLVEAASKRLRQRDGWPEGTLARSAPKEVLNLSVTRATLDRALSLVEALFKVLATHGFEFAIDKERGVTLLRRLETGTELEFALVEQIRRTPHSITPKEERARQRYYQRQTWDEPTLPPVIPLYDYTPTGVLTVTIGRWPSRSWNDTPKRQLEQRIGEVTAGTLALAQETYAKELEEARRKEARAKAVAQYERLTTRRADELERFKQVEASAVNWERASRLRAFAQAVERQAADTGVPTQDQIEWLAWARAKADWLDPLISVSDPILDAPEPKRPGYW